MSKAQHFFDELRRRRVFRVVALYVVGAWVLIQVADLAFPGLDIPESAIRYVWIGAIVGFPIALLTGWFYDFVNGRVVRTGAAAGDTHAELTRYDYVTLGLLAASVVAVTIGLLLRILNMPDDESPRSARFPVDAKSIAVLPFENMSGDPATEPFTLGIHDDLLTHVSKISDIKVISRTSVARLDPSMSIPQIGELLGVATVLESGVQRAGNRVRINAQLIDAVTDQHMWADTFDRELTTQNIFDIQTEIARAITEQLRATLSPQDEANLAKLPTDNLLALEAYMLGNQRMAKRTREDLLAAIDYFKHAVSLDPQYAVAHIGIANSHMLLNNYGFTTLRDAIELANPAIAAALEIDDQLGAVHAARGLALMRAREYDEAELALMRAIELDPNDSAAWHWYGDMLLYSRRDLEKALPLLRKAKELDPLSPVITVTLGEVLSHLGEFDEALALFERSIEIEPDYPGGYNQIGQHMRLVEGRLDEAVRWHHKEISLDLVRSTSILGWTFLDLGDEEAAERWIVRSNNIHPNDFFSKQARIALHRYRGEDIDAIKVARELATQFPGNNASLFVLAALGRYQEILREFAPLYPELSCNAEPQVTRLNFSQAINLSLAHEDTGNKDCSDALLEATLDLFDTMPRKGLLGFGLADAEIYARQGRPRRALSALREAIDQGVRRAWWLQGRDSPHFRSLHDNPAFQELMKEIEDDLAGQLANVRRMEANGELAPIPRLD